MKIILASASPRRAQLLKQIGVAFDVKAVDIDETPLNDESAEDYVLRLAIEKAQAAKFFFANSDVLIIGSDTSVVVDGEILGKPADKQHAFAMLQKLSGRTHKVLTSVAMLGQTTSNFVSTNQVTFEALSSDDLEWYWATGEPKGKAGSYAIQGKAAMFISHLEGSFSGVMGLPLYETTQLLKQHGLKLK
ncbi:MAG TPA: septum formation inhibitor Maf [Cycloclasticus sp.]|jgi:septum formation protein|nr:septum formation inhibitor Maf [Cycloclasticus sp.]HIL91295.1 septum formation inhibitor Maf [Cycloclasticus sp.]